MEASACGHVMYSMHAPSWAFLVCQPERTAQYQSGMSPYPNPACTQQRALPRCWRTSTRRGIWALQGTPGSGSATGPACCQWSAPTQPLRRACTLTCWTALMPTACSERPRCIPTWSAMRAAILYYHNSQCRPRRRAHLLYSPEIFGLQSGAPRRSLRRLRRVCVGVHGLCPSPDPVMGVRMVLPNC